MIKLGWAGLVLGENLFPHCPNFSGPPAFLGSGHTYSIFKATSGDVSPCHISDLSGSFIFLLISLSLTPARDVCRLSSSHDYIRPTRRAPVTLLSSWVLDFNHTFKSIVITYSVGEVGLNVVGGLVGVHSPACRPN